MATNDPEGPDGYNDPNPNDFGLARTAAFTPGGQIEREVLLLAGAKRVGGWRKWFVYAALFGSLFLLLFGLIAGAISALR
jgi:hypothetical protein